MVVAMVYTPDSLYQAIVPTLIFSMSTGTLPFHLVYVSGEHRLEATRTARTVSIVYVLFYTLFLVDASLNPNNLVILNYYQSVVSNLGLVFELIGGAALTYLIYVYNLVRGETMRDTFVRCHLVDVDLAPFYEDTRLKYTFYYQLVHIFSGVGTFGVTAVMQYVNSKAAGFGSLTFSLRVVLLAPLLIIFVMETQYICLATIVQFRFEAINRQLTLLDHNNKLSLSAARNIKVLPISQALASKAAEYAAPSPLQRLHALMVLHDAVCDIVDKINANYGLQIALSIGLKFIISVFSIFYCYWSKVVKGRTLSSVFWFLWAVYNLYELLNLAISCQKATSQARETGAQVHKLLLYTSNAALKEKLSIFSQQLIHRQVKFTAVDLFTIDASLLLAIISAGSTYLIIMLQFQESTDPSQKTTILLNSTHVVEM